MVIQRWQSVLLLIAAVMMGIFSFGSLGQFQLQEYTLNFSSWGIYSEGVPTDGAQAVSVPTIYLTTISVLSALLFLIDIFLFKKLSLQKKVCYIALLTTCATIIQTAILGYTAIEGASVSWSSLICSPFIALIAGYFAVRLIISDHNKLKSIDRIR